MSETLPYASRAFRNLGLPAPLCAAAGLMAIFIAFQAWRYLAVLIAVLLLPVWPVELSLGIFAMLVPFSVVAVGEGDTAMKLGWVVGLGAGAGLLFAGVILGRLQRPPAASRYWILLIIWAGFTVFWASDRGEALHVLTTAISLVLLYLVAVSVRMDEKQFLRVCIMAMLGGCAAAALFADHAAQQGAHARLLGITGTKQDDPNMFAASLLLPLAFASAMSVAQRSWFRRALALVAACVIALGIFFTMSRGALLSIAAMFGVFAYRLRFSRRLILLLLVVVLLLSFMPGLLFERIRQTERGDGRLAIWRVGWTAVVPHYVVFGAGLGNFPVAFTRFGSGAAGIPVGEEFDRDAHNIYLGATAELGLLGITLFGAAIVSHLKQLPRLYARSRGRHTYELLALEAATWGLLVAGFFVNLFWLKLFWLDWILLAQAIAIAERRILPGRTTAITHSKWRTPLLSNTFAANNITR